MFGNLCFLFRQVKQTFAPDYPPMTGAVLQEYQSLASISTEAFDDARLDALLREFVEPAPPRAGLLREQAPVQNADPLDGKVGKLWRCVIIEEGISDNGNYYRADVLERAAKLFERRPVRIYHVGDRHDHVPMWVHRDHPGREAAAVTGNTVGGLKDVRLESVMSTRHPGRTVKALTADLYILDPRTATCLINAKRHGFMPVGREALYQLSIEAEGPHRVGFVEGREVREVEDLTYVKELTIVNEGAAGGVFDECKESKPAVTLQDIPAGKALTEMEGAPIRELTQLGESSTPFTREGLEESTRLLAGQALVHVGQALGAAQTLGIPATEAARTMALVAEAFGGKQAPPFGKKDEEEPKKDDEDEKREGVEYRIGGRSFDTEAEAFAYADKVDLEHSSVEKHVDGKKAKHYKGPSHRPMKESGEPAPTETMQDPGTAGYESSPKEVSGGDDAAGDERLALAEELLESRYRKTLVQQIRDAGHKDPLDEMTTHKMARMVKEMSGGREPGEPDWRVKVVSLIRSGDSEGAIRVLEDLDRSDQGDEADGPPEKLKESKEEDMKTGERTGGVVAESKPENGDDAPVTRAEMREFASFLGQDSRELQQTLREQREETERMRLANEQREHALAIRESNSNLTATLKESGLTPKFRNILEKRFRDTLWDAAELREAIDDQLQACDTLVPQSDRLPAYNGGLYQEGFFSHTSQGACPEDRFQAELDRAMGYRYELDTTLNESQKDVYRNLHSQPSIKRAFQMWYGSEDPTGSHVGPHALCRNASNINPSGTLLLRREAVSADLPNALSTSQTRALVQKYMAQETDHEKICNIVPVSNFKVQDRIIVGGFGRVPVVAEADSGINFLRGGNPADAKLQYAISKRGFLSAVSREAVINDDLHIIQAFPEQMAESCMMELQFGVWGCLIGLIGTTINSALSYDGLPYYATAHNNLTTDPFGYDAVNNMLIRQNEQRKFGNVGTLNANITAGDTTFVCGGSNAAKFAEALKATDKVVVYGGAGGAVETRQVQSVSGTTVTVTAAFSINHTAPARISQLSTNIKYPEAHLIHPSQLSPLVYSTLASTLRPGGGNNDASALWPLYRDQKLKPLQVHSMYLLDNIVNWYMAFGKVIELGFLMGQVLPQLFLQDNPLQNGVFAGEYFTWKCRHEWGLVLLDHLLVQGSIS